MSFYCIQLLHNPHHQLFPYYLQIWRSTMPPYVPLLIHMPAFNLFFKKTGTVKYRWHPRLPKWTNRIWKVLNYSFNNYGALSPASQYQTDSVSKNAAPASTTLSKLAGECQPPNHTDESQWTTPSHHPTAEEPKEIQEIHNKPERWIMTNSLSLNVLINRSRGGWSWVRNFHWCGTDTLVAGCKSSWLSSRCKFSEL